MASRKLSTASQGGEGIPSFAQLVRDSIAAGMTRTTAEAHARNILASYDLIEVDPRTGRSRFVMGGPSITEAVKTPRRKRPKGKTRRLKGAE
jgi:hypothetical protein